MLNNNLFKVRKNFFKTIYLLILFFCIFDIVKATNVRPGTIEKSSVTDSITCSSSTWTSSPRGGECYDIPCKVEGEYNCACGNAVPDTYNCSCGCSGDDCVDPNNCACGNATADTYDCYCGCEVEWNYARGIGTKTFTNYYTRTLDLKYSSAPETQKLTNDLNISCSSAAYGSSGGGDTRIDYYDEYGEPVYYTYDCIDSSIIYYVGGSNGSCYKHTSTDNLISFYNQLGSVERETHTDNDGTCTVEGRYATADNIGPSISINGVSSVFAGGNDDERCQMDKYTNYTSDPETIPYVHCNYYNNLNPNNPGAGEDILKGLEITIDDDDSGIGRVDIYIGGCPSVTYSSASNELSDILVHEKEPNGVKGDYTSGFTLKYDESITALGKTQPSLLEAFGKDRLDKCLVDGKNNIRIVAYDMARSSYDGTTLSANSKIYTVNGYIYVDNSAPKLQVVGDLSKVEAYNEFYGTYNNFSGWRNYTLEGNIQQLEHYNGGDDHECHLFESTGSCSLSLGEHEIFTGPIGVNKTTGEYSLYECGEITIPTDTTCTIGCEDGYSMEEGVCVSNTDICAGVYVGGVLAVLGETAEDIDGVCIPYCIPSHSVSCIVKEDIVKEDNTIIIECVNTSNNLSSCNSAADNISGYGLGIYPSNPGWGHWSNCLSSYDLISECSSSEGWKLYIDDSKMEYINSTTGIWTNVQGSNSFDCTYDFYKCEY